MSKRNRIVIDFSGAASANASGKHLRRTSSGARRVLLIIAVILAVVVIGAAAGGYFWWQHFKSQPAYALALLVDAAQRNDRQETDRIFDYDKISTALVSEVRARMTAPSSILSRLAPEQLDQNAAVATPKLKETLAEVLLAEIQRVSEPAKGKPFILIALGVPYLAEVRQDGANATVDLKFKDEQIQLTMQQNADAWRVTAIKDERLTNVIADAAKKGISQRGSQLQDQIIQKLREMQPNPSP